MLDWYVFNTNTGGVHEETDLVSRAIEFAISIAKNDFAGISRFIYTSDILKLITVRLKRTPYIYQNLKAPSLRPFLESFLTSQYCRPDWDITDYRLVDVRRVVDLAIELWDWSFLPQIELVRQKVCQSAENRIKKDERYDFHQEVRIREAKAYLDEAMRFLTEKKAEEEKEAEVK
jgi:hypothetical protein